MNISEIRLYSARFLSELIGGINAMSDRINKSQSQVSHLISDKPTRNIGNKIAREIEEAFHREKDWLDQPHYDIWSAGYLIKDRFG